MKSALFPQEDVTDDGVQMSSKARYLATNHWATEGTDRSLYILKNIEILQHLEPKDPDNLDNNVNKDFV